MSIAPKNPPGFIAKRKRTVATNGPGSIPMTNLVNILPSMTSVGGYVVAVAGTRLATRVRVPEGGLAFVELGTGE